MASTAIHKFLIMVENTIHPIPELVTIGLEPPKGLVVTNKDN
jgi:hypothetical protein